MGRGKTLSDAEKAKMEAYHACGKSNREIASIIRRSHNVVNTFLKNPAMYGTKKTSGRPMKLSLRDRRAVVRSASNKVVSLNSIKSDLGLAVAKNTVRNTLARSGVIVRRKMRIGSISTVHIDIVSWYLGEPVAASYVPSMTSTDGDNMSFFARFKNAIGSVLGAVFLYGTYGAETEVLTNVFKNDYSNTGDLIGQTSFMFTNENPFLNYPRPVLHKTVAVGGISVDVENVGELGEVLNERNHTVFISFGSVAKSKDMPAAWKKSILEFCGSMPEVTFIWKYEEPSDMADHLPNVHLSPWLPQNALLDDPRLSLFITHGGLGSTTEVAHLGKPAIMLPLFGDQPRNAEMLARHG